MKLLVQFPTYARPKKFIDVFMRYVETCSQNHEIFFNINCDASDLTMTNKDVVNQIHYLLNFKDNVNGNVWFDKNTNKISAINDHIEGRDFDVVICASDDMIPQENNWDDIIAKDMQKYFPNFNGALHYFDGYQTKSLITLSILGVELYNHFGYIYHPDYKSLYCDNEFTHSVYRIGRVKYIDRLIIKHEHYGEQNNSNSGDFDLSAQKTLMFARRDQQVFERRKELGFPKGRITND